MVVRHTPPPANVTEPPYRSASRPAEAVHRARGSLTHFDRLEVWQAVGTADPWLVGAVRTPSGRERFYLVYDWGVETSAGRDALR